jgi:hypothetical protein
MDHPPFVMMGYLQRGEFVVKEEREYRRDSDQVLDFKRIQRS